MNNQSATMNTKDNPLGYKKESTLLVGFAIPCIISMLVTALYNIVDQIFIGQGIGMLEMLLLTLHFHCQQHVRLFRFFLV